MCNEIEFTYFRSFLRGTFLPNDSFLFSVGGGKYVRCIRVYISLSILYVIGRILELALGITFYVLRCHCNITVKQIILIHRCHDAFEFDFLNFLKVPETNNYYR